MKRNLDQTLGSLPPEWGQTLLPAIHARVESTRRKVVVLDDDPTGTQTVHNVDVLTKWSLPLLEDALRSPETVVYLLTNSRSLPPRQARDLTREIATNLIAAREFHRPRFHRHQPLRLHPARALPPRGGRAGYLPRQHRWRSDRPGALRRRPLYHR